MRTLLSIATLIALATTTANSPDAAAFAPQSSETESIQYNPPTHLDKIDERRTGPLDRLYQYPYTGVGVTIYIVDSGVNIHHSDLFGRASVAYDPFGGSVLDATGHGTHVAGIAAGVVSGVAKRAIIRSVRVKNTSTITEANLVAGLQVIHREVINGKRGNRSVVNMSLDPGYLRNLAVRTEIERLLAANVVVVFAAGNSPSFGNRNICSTFVDIPNLYMVGNGDVDGIAYNSYGGPCIDAYAPGTAIVSAASGNNTGFASLTGSSQSAPQAAGIAALILQKYPTASVAKVVSLIDTRAVIGRMSQANGSWVPGSNNRLLYALPYGE
jgi:aqualysin 1